MIRRDQLKELVALEARREEHHLHPGVKKEAALLQKQLVAHLEKIEAQIEELLAVSDEVKTRVERLTQVAGVGTISAYTLLAYLPELGKLSRGAIAALAGVAPMNADSGPIRGQRHIRGGRAHARKALYMAALCATLHNPLLKTFYKTLRGRSKPRQGGAHRRHAKTAHPSQLYPQNSYPTYELIITVAVRPRCVTTPPLTSTS